MIMIKKHWKQLLLSSAVILLPVVVGLLLWDRLPDTMNIHWGTDGQPDGTAGKALAVFLPAALLLGFHWLCAFLTNKSMANQPVKAIALGLWICPVISLTMHSLMYTVALGLEVNFGMLLFLPMGLMFVVIGNYMPKVRRNANMGIKTPWALADDENWYATHRFGGKCWMFGGLLVMVLSCLPWNWAVGATFVSIFAFAFAPAIYSWNFFRKQKASGKEVPAYRSPYGKWVWLFMAVLAVVLVIVMFTGQITYAFEDDALTVDASFWDPVTVEYADIDAVEYRENAVDGERMWGYGSGRLLLGSFRNEEFGGYTRYTYTGDNGCVILTVGEKILVIADKDAEATRAIYEQITEKIG